MGFIIQTMRNHSISLTLFVLFFCCGSLLAQDTLRVQTFTYEDITKRRAWFEFPTQGQTYRKILMNHKLKCDSQTQQDNFACGEWDYTTYNDIYTYLGVGTNYYRFGSQHLDTIFYSSSPLFDVYQSIQFHPVYSDISNEVSVALGSGGSVSPSALRADRMNNRIQFVYTADELSNAGITAGSIDRIGMDISELGESELDFLRIAMKHHSGGALDTESPDSEGFTEVYLLNTSWSGTGEQTFDFYQPFEWDGVSDLLVEITSIQSESGVATNPVTASEVSEGLVIQSAQQERYIDLDSDGYVEIPAEVFEDVDEQITISFWCYGDPDVLPFNTWVLEGRDSSNQRVVNVHLPWGNGRVYWDAGNDGTNSYDRIDLEVDPADFAGRWTHWSFVKNAASGDMQIYMDGELLHSGTGLNRSMEGITRFKLGGRADVEFGGNYDGSIDEFQVWSKALTQEEIQQTLYRSVTPDHPQYAFLEGAYAFNQTGAIVTDYSDNGLDGTLMGQVARTTMQPESIFLNMESSTTRPDVTLYRGDYQFELVEETVEYLVEHPQASIIESIPFIDTEVAGISHELLDTVLVYLAEPSITYGPDGEVVSEEEVADPAFYANEYKQERHQLQNYVTPYGIGLSLGTDGFRWQYEVTDYRPLFEGWVEIAAGNQQELIDLEFQFIEGTPPRDVLEMESIWLGDFPHAQIADDIVLPAVDRTIRDDASSVMLRSRTTGHWFGGVLNCAEFCPKYFHIEIDDVERFEWLNWKECADNPVIGQGGTWIYDRAGWCPATFADTYDYDITPFVEPGETHSINFGMQPYVPGGGEGNYRTTLQMFQYDAYAHQLDLEVSDIISPNKWEYYNRYNPICMDPEIEIRNLGEQTITSATIEYWIEGGQSETYEWTGELAFNESTRVILPISDQSFWNEGEEETIGEFYVSVSAPNGEEDEYGDNDMMMAEFEFPDVHSQPFFIWFKSNNAPNENSYHVYDENGEVVFERTSFEVNTTYRDTLELPDGCYYIRLEDTGHDGLSFFANNDGSGLFRLRYVGGSVIEYFDADFGSFIEYHFRVDGVTSVSEHLDDELVTILPNPSTGLFSLAVDKYEGSELALEIYDSRGALVYKRDQDNILDNMLWPIDLSAQPDGIYLARVLIDGRALTRRLVKQ
jgi:hypothetical protein